MGEAQQTVGADDEVAAELASVVGWPSEFLPGAHELYVHLDRCGPVDLTQGTSPKAIRTVRVPVFVAQHRERDVEMAAVAGK